MFCLLGSNVAPQTDPIFAPGTHSTPPVQREAPGLPVVSARSFNGELIVVLIFLGVWLAGFDSIYGWLMDDRATYIKGVDVVNNIRAVFSYWNILHAYFIIDSYLPILTGICVPSFEVPLFGPSTCNFRFTIAYTIFLHAIVLLSVAVLFWATNISKTQRVLALALVAISPAITFWAPQLDSRVLGVPCVIAGILLMQFWPTDRSENGLPSLLAGFIAGIMFWTGQSTHYTSLYLIVPFALAYVLTTPLVRWRLQTVWLFWIGMGIGFALPMIALEIAYLHVPGAVPNRSPFLDMVKVGSLHQSKLEFSERLRFWATAATGLYGIPFLLLCATYVASVGHRVMTGSERFSSLEVRLLLTAIISVALVVLSPGQSFARQLSVTVPLLCLCAVCGAASVLRIANRHPRWQLTLAAGLAVLTTATPAVQSLEIFQAHRSLGQALAFAEQQQKGAVAWLQPAWFPEDPRSSRPLIRTRAELDALPPDTLVVSYQPWAIFNNMPSLRAQMLPEHAEFVGPTLYSTFAMWAELFERGHPDFRRDDAMTKVMVFRAEKLRSPHEQAVLRVAAISGSAESVPNRGPEKVFDRDAGGKDAAWISTARQLPAILNLKFAEPTTLDQLLVLSRAMDSANVYPDAIEVAGRRTNGEMSLLWSGTGLAPNPAIRATWPAAELVELEIRVLRTVDEFGRNCGWLELEEIVFPGRRVVLPEAGSAPPSPPSGRPRGLTLTKIPYACPQPQAGIEADQGE